MRFLNKLRNGLRFRNKLKLRSIGFIIKYNKK